MGNEKLREKYVAYFSANNETEIFGTFEEAEEYLQKKYVEDEECSEETTEGKDYIATITHKSQFIKTEVQEHNIIGKVRLQELNTRPKPEEECSGAKWCSCGKCTIPVTMDEPMTDTDLRKGLEEIKRKYCVCGLDCKVDADSMFQSILTYLKENNLLGE